MSRSQYRNPALWRCVWLGLLMALLGTALEIIMPFGWATRGGLIAAGFFLLCIVANWVGTHFCHEAKFLVWLPPRIISVTIFSAFVSVLLAASLGIKSESGTTLLYCSGSAVVIFTPVAFFLRGMAESTQYDP